MRRSGWWRPAAAAGVPLPRISGSGCRLVGIRLDQAGIDRKALAAYQPLIQAALHHRLEQMTEQIAFAKAVVAVLGEGGVIGHLAFQTQAAELPVGKIAMQLLAQALLGADAEAVADQQHADHQLGINARATGGAVEAGQMLAQLGAVDEAIDTSQQVIGRDMVLKVEPVEQALLHHETLAYHGSISC
jgi:hypothetical protein